MVTTPITSTSSPSNMLELEGMSSIGGIVELSGSKSLSNLVLLLVSLSEGVTKIKNLLVNEDGKHMEFVLRTEWTYCTI